MNTGCPGKSRRNAIWRQTFSFCLLPWRVALTSWLFTHLNCVIKISFEHFYRQSDAIKFSSGLIRLSKQDTKKPIRSWASFQIIFPAAHILPEVILPLPSIKSPNNAMFIISGVGHFSHCLQCDNMRWKGSYMLWASVVLVSSRSIPTSGNST